MTFAKFTTADNLKIWEAWKKQNLLAAETTAKEAYEAVVAQLEADNTKLSRKLNIKKMRGLAAELGQHFKREHGGGGPSTARVELVAKAFLDLLEGLALTQNHTEVREVVDRINTDHGETLRNIVNHTPNQG